MRLQGLNITTTRVDGDLSGPSKLPPKSIVGWAPRSDAETSNTNRVDATGVVRLRAADEQAQTLSIVLPETVHILQGEAGRLTGDDAARAIATYGLRSCSGVFLWNPETRDTWCFHIANKSDLDHFEQMLDDVTADGPWQITLCGGNSLGERQERYGDQTYNHRLLSSLCKRRDGDRVTLATIPRSGKPATLENDRAYLCDRETGEVVEIDNAKMVAVEDSAPEQIGPDCRLRWVYANLFPAFDDALYPTVLSYDDGQFTGALNTSRDVDVTGRVDELKRRFADGTTEPELSDSLHELFADNEYLLNRIDQEPAFLTYVFDALKTLFEPPAEHPGPAPA